MRNYKHLTSLIKATSHKRITLNNLISGRAYFEKGGWEKFTYELNEKDIDSIKGILGGRKDTPQRIDSALRYRLGNIAQCGILDRLYVRKAKGKNVYWSYCAGQDYTAELKTVRDHLKNQ
jgi:hypothetical protein